jgi:hypothetical protein
MLHITLSDCRSIDPGLDPLGRAEVGYRADMTDAELYQASRAAWVLGVRADREQFALVSHGGVVRLAIAISRIVPAGARRAIEGKVLGPGDEVYDRYVDQPSPVQSRNPIHYFDAPIGHRFCKCGCGNPVVLGHFVAGHDQKAIHERIARVGTVADFLDWFDAAFDEGGGRAE